MINKLMVQNFNGNKLLKGDNYIYLPPNPLLLPYISNYTITCPTPETMPDQYTILPTASTTLIYTIGNSNISSSLRGVNSKPIEVGAYANKQKLMILIEFHPAGLYPLLKIPQNELLDKSFSFDVIDISLDNKIRSAIINENSIQSLIDKLDSTFISYYSQVDFNPQFLNAIDYINKNHGAICIKKLSKSNYYSEKHLRRLFNQYIGTGLKTYSRIVRFNYALKLIKFSNESLASISIKAGYFDQSHFIKEFISFCNTSPQTYQKNMSVFYNDSFKM